MCFELEEKIVSQCKECYYSRVPSPDHADVRVRLGEGPGAGGGRAVAAGVTGDPANINYRKPVKGHTPLTTCFINVFSNTMHTMAASIFSITSINSEANEGSNYSKVLCNAPYDFVKVSPHGYVCHLK